MRTMRGVKVAPTRDGILSAPVSAISMPFYARFPRLSVADRGEVLQSLAARPKSGWKLTLAIKQGTIPVKEVPAYVARQLRRVVGTEFVVDTSTIQSRETVEGSLMPEGLLGTLSDKEVIDLVAYLRRMGGGTAFPPSAP